MEAPGATEIVTYHETSISSLEPVLPSESFTWLVRPLETLFVPPVLPNLSQVNISLDCWLFEKVLKNFEILGLISDEHSPWAERTIGAIVIVAITLINLGGQILRKCPNFHAQSNPWF